MKHTATVTATFQVEYEVTDPDMTAAWEKVAAIHPVILPEAIAHGVALAISTGLDAVNEGGTRVFLRPMGEGLEVIVEDLAEVTE